MGLWRVIHSLTRRVGRRVPTIRCSRTAVHDAKWTKSCREPYELLVRLYSSPHTVRSICMKDEPIFIQTLPRSSGAAKVKPILHVFNYSSRTRV